MFLRTVCLITLSIWFGGFIFYSGFVISAAHAVLGDHEIVGMITQKVTDILNICGFVAVTLLGINYLKSKQFWKLKKLSLSLWIFLLLSLVCLVLIHLKMDGFIDSTVHEVKEGRPFYRWHRIYLIISTAQFLATLIYIPLMLKAWKSQDVVGES